MIKEQSFEWLLEGCHRIADVARLPAEGSDGPGLYRQDCPPHPRTDRHSPELLGDARPREGYGREKSVSSGL